MQKLYCYVDETGQDAGSDFFIVVAIIVTDEPEFLRKQLIELEKTIGVGNVKWHKLSHSKRIEFLFSTLQMQNTSFRIYYGKYKKILPFFLPLIETISKSIKDVASQDYRALVCVDGIDRKKAAELTFELRQQGINLKYVRTARDESEVLIRLADRWAGCLRLDAKRHPGSTDLVALAKKKGLLKQI